MVTEKKQPEVYNAIQQITMYINAHDPTYEHWYIGIAKDPNKRLFQQHSVDKTWGDFLVIETSSDEIAREVESYFTETSPIQGGPRGGNEASKYVYIYKITLNTKEEA